MRVRLADLPVNMYCILDLGKYINFPIDDSSSNDYKSQFSHL